MKGMKLGNNIKKKLVLLNLDTQGKKLTKI